MTAAQGQREPECVCPRGHRHFEEATFCTVCGVGPVLRDTCSCCGRRYSYDDSHYWYTRKPSRFWRLAARVVCYWNGCRLNCDYADCYRCG